MNALHQATATGGRDAPPALSMQGSAPSLKHSWLRPLRRLRRTALLGFAVAASGFLPISSALAHSIDYVAADISPAANFQGSSGNFTLIDSVAGGDEINFNLTFSINTSGSTTIYSKTIVFSPTDITTPLGAPDPVVTFGSAGAATFSKSFASAADTAVTSVKIIAPSVAGAYSVKITATSGTGGMGGLSGGNGIVVSFTVAGSSCEAADTDLLVSVEPACIVLHEDSVNLIATLTSGSPATVLSGKTVEFFVNGNDGFAGEATTNASGVAELDFNPSELGVGNHSVQASFQGQECLYNAASNSASLGVTYDFAGFQPPVAIDGMGVGLFSGKVIPVKIKIADAYGDPVTDAEVHLFYKKVSSNLDPNELVAEPIANTNADSGNKLRYDFVSEQYILNWNVSSLVNGAYSIRVGLDEGECAGARAAEVYIKKNSKK